MAEALFRLLALYRSLLPSQILSYDHNIMSLHFRTHKTPTEHAFTSLVFAFFVWTIVAARSYLVFSIFPRKNMVCCASAYCTHSHYGYPGCIAKCINHWWHDGVSNNGNGIDHHDLVFGPRGAVLPGNIVVVVVIIYVDCLNRLVTFYPLTLVACFNFHHIMGFKIRCLQDPIDEGWLEEFFSKDGRLYAADESSALALKAKHLKHTLVEPTAEALELACHQLSLRKFEGSSKVSKALPQSSMDHLELMQKLVKDACKILVQMLERATLSRSSLPPLSSTHNILFCNTAELHASCLILAGLYPAPSCTADNWTNNPTCRNLKRFFTHFVLAN